MKLITFVVPSYNSQDYLHYCIESLLCGKNDSVEILIINDGSSDDTAKIADKYALIYPETVKVIHQENAGHGGAVNAGILNAEGIYLKVVDSDDWVDTRAYLKLIEELEKIVNFPEPVDMLVSNFVYEKEAARFRKVMKFDNVFPEGKVVGWEDIGKIKVGQYLLMHSVIFRTSLLRECSLVLPEHTFYVDNLFVFQPLQYVKTMYYLNLDLYRYFIGREDQSINENIMIKRIDQQLKVNKLMVMNARIEEVESQTLRNYLYHYLEIITVVSSILLIRSKSKENIAKMKELWTFIRENDPCSYKFLRRGLLGTMLNIPGRFSRMLSVGLYKISRKAFGFN
ncbi:MAG: glycosyltransferase family 2 protein [Spirochaetales bacterium]|nr:glycosyltransferase family 2 protein [Spirochaetales bacterium]